MIRNLDFLKLQVTASVRSALELINRFTKYRAVIVYRGHAFWGLVTEGDLRRSLLNGCKLSDDLSTIVNRDPVFLEHNQIVMKNFKNDTVYPILIDGKHHFFFHHGKSRLKKPQTSKEIAVLIMAGGFGTRLRPLTENCPKPMLKINGKTILEIIVDRLISQGFKKFIISTHYLPNVIIDCFRDGRKLGCEIAYLHEESPLGTGGALSLIDLDSDLLITNGDIITNLDFVGFYNNHIENLNDVTIAVRKYDHQIPFGVIRRNGGISIEEKPMLEFEVSAGIYCLNKKVLNYAKSLKGAYDFPDFINNLRVDSFQINTYAFDNQWIDVGRPEDLKLAKTQLL